MMRRLRAWASLALAAAGLCLLGCQEDRLAGGGTETGNAEVVAGRVMDASGQGLAAVEVDLQEVKTAPDGTDAGRSFTATTDASGHYLFTSIKPGHYALHARGNGAAAVSALRTRLEKKAAALTAADMVPTETVTLMGRVFPPASVKPADMRVCVPGLRVCVPPGADSVYRIDKVPRGSFELLFLCPASVHYLGLTVRPEDGNLAYLRDVALTDSADADHLPYRFYDLPQANGFSTVPVRYPTGREPAWYLGKTMGEVDYFFLLPEGQARAWDPDFFSAWPHAKVLAGDSLVAAPDLAAPLQGFALPIRLSAPGFDFSQAKADGADIAFSDAQGRPLSHEIESWDPIAGRAAVWVRLESLAAAKADRKVVLHWGHAYPASFPNGSDGSAVFRKPDGYLAAWHLAESVPDGKVHEARGAFPGTLALGPYLAGAQPAGIPASGAALLEALDGAIAKAFQMGTTGTYIHVPYQAALDVTSAFTVSVWARVSTADTAHKQVFASKWQLGRREWHFDLQPNRTFELEFGDSAGAIQGTWRSVAPVAGPERWHHYAATFSGGIVRLYLDGAEVAGAGATGSVPTVIHHFRADLNIGSNSIDVPLNWAGDMDELELYSEAKSADWLNMAYRSQKPNP